MSQARVANRLAGETSPYLVQHAHNPVDWYPWSPEAIEKARTEDKPIFLSVGYSACHWCHVMERESFEDPQTASLMNDRFVNVKVDREERPDLDQIYMAAVQLMTQRGGWPMSVWLTPDLKPFYGGTYFPPDRRMGMPSFCDVLERVSEAWQFRRQEVLAAAEQLTEGVQQVQAVRPAEGELDANLIETAGRRLASYVDLQWGGIGGAPKFPHSVELRLILRAARRCKSQEMTDLVTLSLDRMVRGGIYDQLGGGFHRYSTDQRWLVPHFEKMLYDNALIPQALLEAFQATGIDEFRRATVETLEYVLREMTAPEGPFYSTQDADSEGEEGKYFVWTKDEITRLLGKERGELFGYCYGVSEEGNWEDKTILHLPKPLSQSARLLEIPEPELRVTLDQCRKDLLAARGLRVPPGRDEKVLTSWNAMMIDTLAVASMVLGEPRYEAAASRAAEFLLGTMRTPAGLLYRTWKDGRARLNGYLEDYAYLANALVSLYEATFEPRWIESALGIVEVMGDQFWDEKEGAYFYTGKDHEPLISRGKDPNDNAIPSGNAMAVTALVRLARLTGRSDLSSVAERSLSSLRGVMMDSPSGGTQLLLALGLLAGPAWEFVIAGDPEADETRRMLRGLHSRYLPDKVVALRRPQEPPETEKVIGLVAGKTAQKDGPTAYICQNFACRAPAVGLDAFENELATLIEGRR